ncbi:MAG TPA: hypothetical protein VER96_24495 [Polyangiaceae bacterium]|nr:hypothetical protein [Polyangiaceae bacterium]
MKPMQFDGKGEQKKPPSKDDLHDIIILPKNAADPATAAAEQAVKPRVQRFRINREKGKYEEKPEDLAASIPGGRKARALGAPDERYGPGLVLAPTRPEPAAQNGTCIIVNQENLRIRNAWTAARLDNEPPAPKNEGVPAAAGPETAEPDEYKLRLTAVDTTVDFELLVASAEGKVFLVSNNKPPRELADMGREGEIWYQLRNGFIVGSVFCRELDKVIPMVNVMSLIKVPEPDPSPVQAT